MVCIVNGSVNTVRANFNPLLWARNYYNTLVRTTHYTFLDVISKIYYWVLNRVKSILLDFDRRM